MKISSIQTEVVDIQVITLPFGTSSMSFILKAQNVYSKSEWETEMQYQSSQQQVLTSLELTTTPRW